MGPNWISITQKKPHMDSLTLHIQANGYVWEASSFLPFIICFYPLSLYLTQILNYFTLPL